jgi:hypothetical protein
MRFGLGPRFAWLSLKLSVAVRQSTTRPAFRSAMSRTSLCPVAQSISIGIRDTGDRNEATN